PRARAQFRGAPVRLVGAGRDLRRGRARLGRGPAAGRRTGPALAPRPRDGGRARMARRRARGPRRLQRTTRPDRRVSRGPGARRGAGPAGRRAAPAAFTGRHAPPAVFLAAGGPVAKRAERLRLSVLDVAPLLLHL